MTTLQEKERREAKNNAAQELGILPQQIKRISEEELDAREGETKVYRKKLGVYVYYVAVAADKE